MSARNLAKVANSINPNGSFKDNGIIQLDHIVTTYDSYGSLPRSGLSAGQQALTVDNNTLFITDGTLWYRTAVVNATPKIQSILDDSGNPAPFNFNDKQEINVTVTFVDSDGFGPFTYNAVPDSDFNGLATISQDGSMFTITRLDSTVATTDTGNVVFTVSDGINLGTSSAQKFTSVAVAPGQAEYTTPGTYSWTAPAGITSVSVVAVGGGGGGTERGGSGGRGGAGGGLGWKNNIAVVPGQSYTVVVGDGGARGSFTAGNGGISYFIDAATVAGQGGIGGNDATQALGGSYVGDGGGNGGNVPFSLSTADVTGGGGAGGYTGNGGNGGDINANNATAGSGGGGGGGGSAGSADASGAGGGVGIYGQGANGAAGIYNGSNGTSGGGGSGGNDGQPLIGGGSANPAYGGDFGGGGGGADNTIGEHGPGGKGAVRIIWNGAGALEVTRAFPATNTQDL